DVQAFGINVHQGNFCPGKFWKQEDISEQVQCEDNAARADKSDLWHNVLYVLNRLSRLHLDHLDVPQAETLQCLAQCSGCTGEYGESTVVHGDDVIYAEHAYGNGSLSRSHGVEVADG